EYRRDLLTRRPRLYVEEPSGETRVARVGPQRAGAEGNGVLAPALHQGRQVRPVQEVDRLPGAGEDALGLADLPVERGRDAALARRDVLGELVVDEVGRTQPPERQEAPSGDAHDLGEARPMHPAAVGREMPRLVADRFLLLTQAVMQQGQAPRDEP